MFGSAAKGSEAPARDHQDWVQAPPPAAAAPQAATPSLAAAPPATRSELIEATLPATPTSGQLICPLFEGDQLPLMGSTFAEKKWESKGKISSVSCFQLRRAFFKFVISKKPAKGQLGFSQN